jgi:antibiotic biosynthesis monooxygenase (ABM) superfamily enzyme
VCVWARAVIDSAQRLRRRAQSDGCARRREQTAARDVTRLRGQRRRPPRYKTAAVTWLAIYPLVLALSTLLTRLELGLPRALSILLVTLVTVLVATYVALPVLSWLLRPWLVPTRDRKRNRDPPR